MHSARDRADFSQVRRIGVDETASRRGQNDISLFHDFDEGRLLFACASRDQRTVARFAEDLSAHGGDPERVEAARMDMSKAYIAGAGKHLPKAAITFDAFHVIQLANEAVDAVRRAEIKREPALKHSRWTWLKDKHHWTKRQMSQAHDLTRLRLTTSPACA